jgi:hypothetical protein
MSILRAVAMVAVVVFCAGFIPVGGCAKGCGAAGRAASHSGDDIARLGVRGTAVGVGAESVAVSGSRYADDLARTGTYSDDLARTGVAGHADDLAHTGVAGHADDLAHAADDVHLAGVADELEQSGLKLSENQHGEVMDALQDVAEEVVGQLADTDDEDDAKQIKRAAAELEARLQKTLTAQQLRRFHAKYGTSEAVAYRLGGEQQLKRAGAAGQK